MSKFIKKTSKVEVDTYEDREAREIQALLNGEDELFDEELELEEEEDFEGFLQEFEEEKDIEELLQESEDEIVDIEDLNVNDEEVINLLELKPTKSKPSKKLFGEEGVCTIVNSKQNGNKRIVLSSKVLDEIGNPIEVEVGIMPNGIAISSSLPIETNVFQVRKQGAKKVIYSGALVAELTNEFNLDYSTRTSITFNQVRYEKVEGNIVAVIQIA